MSGAAILLALASVVRPTSLAAVVALLVSARPKRLLLAYILAGFVVSVVIGVLVVSLLHKLATHHPKSHAGFELGLGVVVLAGAGWVVIRERRHPEDRRESSNGDGHGEGKIAKRLRNPTIAAAGHRRDPHPRAGRLLPRRPRRHHRNQAEFRERRDSGARLQ